MSYLNDFLFSPERANSPVRTLSGGERNRVLLARLFALPANVLVLDEPTNDLDIDTLELLEELLQSYPGTVFLVSHDRRFLDNVVTSLICWEGDLSPGRWREYEGGIADWKVQAARSAEAQARSAKIQASTATSPAAPAAPANSAPKSVQAVTAERKKLSFKEQRELSELPGRIEALEAEQATLAAAMASADFYKGSPREMAEATARHASLDDALVQLMERWEALSSRGA
jgi:ATP-binding cassette subfamily F protein uup